MKSTVYFAKVNAAGPKERASAMTRLLAETGGLSAYKKDEIVPVKLTLGDSQCAHYVAPGLVKMVLDELKNKKARPFLFDTNVIYKGQRHNAVDHMTLANNRGFGQSKVGAPFIIADGLLGQDGREFHIKSPHISKVKVPSFIGMLDHLVVLSHVTGHIVAGYAGAIKNVAMGMACRPTKQVQHSSLKPQINAGKCVACGCCMAICPVSAISMKDGKAVIDQAVCVGCGECLCACKFDAVSINWHEDAWIFAQRMAEVAAFVLAKFKGKFFINFAFDITKECDCISTKDDKIIAADLGILASDDIVSLDKATVDLINREEDIFLKEQGHDEYYRMLEYAASLGMGSLDYNLKII